MKNIYYRRKRYLLTRLTTFLLLPVILSLILLSGGCAGQNGQEPLTASAFKLNTIVSLQVYDAVNPSILTEALALCDYYELIFSRTNPDSELYRLNEAASTDILQDYPISGDLYALLDKSLSYASLSHGAFDVTIGPLASLWDFQAETPMVPEDALIKRALALVGYDKVRLTDHAVSLPHKGICFDAGASAKGYIADRIRDFLVANGVEHAIISLGGNVLCIGSRPNGSAFCIGVRKPFWDTSETALLLNITDKSVVTTGIYERFFEQDGKLYHHIINPFTGYPYDNDIASVTIITECSADADILSTACFALGAEQGLSLIASLPDTEAVYLMTDGSILYSGGFPDYLSADEANQLK